MYNFKPSTYEDMIDDSLSGGADYQRRRRGRPRKSEERGNNGAKGNYFQSAEDHIMIYVMEDDKSEKDKIFNRHLYSPLYFMTQTILMRYFWNKYQIDESPEDIITDTLSFLLTKIDNFDPSKGFKAYSYIQAVIKHYIQSKYVTYQKNIKRNYSLSEVYEDIKTKEYSVTPDERFEEKLFNVTIKNIKDAMKTPEEHNLTQKDCIIGKCLVELLENWETAFEDINGSRKLTRWSLLYRVSETTLYDVKQIRQSLKKLRDIYKTGKKEFVNIF
jgi:hypothetical protein